ncbi:MAG: putative extracellular ligand-binding protein [Frankiales bacterium]|nr:putative extracellular ligand-binding protein [Frankiales bacterium]
MAHPARTWRVVTLAAVATLALGACGDDSTDTASPSTSGGASASAAPSVAKNVGDGVLTVGSLLPQTGNLAFLGPPEFAGVELAVKEINAAGGVLGKPVKYEAGDSGDAQQDVANPTVDRLLAAKADVIVGAASSGVSFTVIDKIAAAGVVEISPANTSPKFTDYDDKGQYFRTAPSDVLQGRVLGETISADGFSNVGIIALQDPYGEGLSKNVGDTVKAQGGQLAPSAPVFYDPAGSNFDAQVGQLKAAKPDAIVLIGFEESSKVIQAMVAQGIGPQTVPLYLVDGNLSNTLGKGLPAGVLKGVKGSLPGASAPGDFRKRVLTINPKLVEFPYTAESYDAVVVNALAAIAGKSDAGTDLAKNLPDVTRGGTKCTTFAECKKLLDADNTADIDYDGVSGPIEFSDKGDPTQASIGIYTYGANNTYDADKGEYQTGKIEG